MSLVGTRPILQDELLKYELHHRARIAIKPGITGMWQVSGRSDITDFEEVVRLDTEYISNWNFGLDIKILFKTVMTVLKREGSVSITSLTAEISSITANIDTLKADLKEKKTALKKAEKEVVSLEAKKAKADAKAAEEAKKTEVEAVLKKLLASGMSADEILEKLK